MNARKTALSIMVDVVQKGRSLTQCLMPILDQDNASLIKQYCFESCRWYFQANSYVKQLLEKPLKEKDFDIMLIMIMGIVELTHMSKPEHAVVNEWVLLSTSLDKSWAKGLVNAVLRGYLRRQETLNNNRYSHPKWLIKQLQRDWPEHWEAIIEANNEHPPMFIRINPRHQSAEDYLRDNALEGTLSPVAQDAICLNTPMPVQQLPGFSEGYIAIQDESAQLAAHLLDAKPNQRVLDACAAPGGKTCHLAEIQSDLAELVALDIDAKRIALIQENLTRHHLKATVIAADAKQPDTWWDHTLFDRILLDAPCSATGIIRRHPDIKLHRTKNDIPKLAETQLALLQALWPLLKPGGRLLYATCSVLKQENCDIIAKFLTITTDAQHHPIVMNVGQQQTLGLQIFPSQHKGDGFYYAALEKSIP